MSANINARHELFRSLEPGAHLCQFYHRSQDLYEGVFEYLIEGLKVGDYCVWITTEPLSLPELKNCLKEDIPEFEEYVQSGQLELIDSRQWYFDADGRFLSLEALLHNIEDLIDYAHKRGFQVVRGSGNLGPINPQGWKTIVEYEEGIAKCMSQIPIIAQCCHSLIYCPLSRISELIDYHDLTFYQKGQRWETLSAA